MSGDDDPRGHGAFRAVAHATALILIKAAPPPTLYPSGSSLN
jgi:hypothetical protein